MLVDRINMNQEISDMVEDLDAIKVRNDQEAAVSRQSTFFNPLRLELCQRLDLGP